MTDALGKTAAPVIGIIGWKNSGKTTLVVRLIAELTRRGMRVASVKHAHHDFRIDDAETDSARHRRAGAAQVAIVSSQRWALVAETPEHEIDLSSVIAMLAPADLIVVEGYKNAAIPKIEARRGSATKDKALAPEDPHVMAIAAEAPSLQRDALPVFELDDVAGIADFVVERLGLKVAPRTGLPPSDPLEK